LSASGNVIAFYRVVVKAVNNQINAGNILLFIQALNNIQRRLKKTETSSKKSGNC
jgi:large-conductance mechanosensitive channel